AAEESAALQIVNAYAVHLHVVVVEGHAVGYDRDSAIAAIAPSQIARIGYIGSHTRIQSYDLGIVARNQRQRGNLFAGGNRPQGARLGLHELRLGSDGDLFLNRAYSELNVESCRFGNVDREPCLDRRFEAGPGEFHTIGTRRQQRNRIASVALRHYLSLLAGRLVDHGYLHIRYHGSRWIGDLPRQSTGAGVLCKGRRRD